MDVKLRFRLCFTDGTHMSEIVLGQWISSLIVKIIYYMSIVIYE